MFNMLNSLKNKLKNNFRIKLGSGNDIAFHNLSLILQKCITTKNKMTEIEAVWWFNSKVPLTEWISFSQTRQF